MSIKANKQLTNYSCHPVKWMNDSSALSSTCFIFHLIARRSGCSRRAFKSHLPPIKNSFSVSLNVRFLCAYNHCCCCHSFCLVHTRFFGDIFSNEFWKFELIFFASPPFVKGRKFSAPSLVYPRCTKMFPIHACMTRKSLTRVCVLWPAWQAVALLTFIAHASLL